MCKWLRGEQKKNGKNGTFEMWGNSSRRRWKNEDGEAAVDVNMQSSTAGMAAGGTRRKLLKSEATIESIEFRHLYTLLLVFDASALNPNTG